MQLVGWRVAAVTAVVLLGAWAGLAQQPLTHQYLREKQDPAGGQVFWRPQALESDGSLLGALAEFGEKTDQDRLLRSRGEIRSLNFRYKNFTYERDFFHVYKGLRLHSFLDGKVDVGLYKHQLFQGLQPGPAGAYLPSTSKRLELMIRWNLNESRGP